MARIIFSTVSGLPNSNKLPCFYEGLIKALEKAGNEVLVIINNKLIRDHWNKNKTETYIDKVKLDKELIKFNPDLVITANNSLYEEIPKLFDCPILIYCTDSPSGFSDKDRLKNNISRYHILLPTESLIPSTYEYFGENIKNVHVVQFATDFVAQDIEQNKNISFIGTNFTFAGDEFKKIFKKNFDDSKRKDLIKFFTKFREDVLKKPSYYLDELGIDKKLFKDLSHIYILNLLSCNTRLQTLCAIADLGLSLYGSKSWYDVCEYSIDLALSFIEQEVSSVQDNQDIYNSSKISINISHAQAGNAFSWRVRDIMACNSALVSDPRKDLVTYFSKYVKIPTYENPFEARQICEKLLKDEKWRKEIVIGSQKAIEEGHRFKHRIMQIEQIIGFSLKSKNKGSITFLNPDNFHKPIFRNKDLFLKKNGIIRSTNRKRNALVRKVRKFLIK